MNDWRECIWSETISRKSETKWNGIFRNTSISIQVSVEYDYDDADDFYDNNHVDNNKRLPMIANLPWTFDGMCRTWIHHWKKAAVKEYGEKRTDLNKNVTSNFEEKQKSIEAERHNIKLTGESYSIVETKTEHGKLMHKRRWIHRGRPIYLQSKDLPKFSVAHIVSLNGIFPQKKLNYSISCFVVFQSNNSDTSHVRIQTSCLSRGKVDIKWIAN